LKQNHQTEKTIHRNVFDIAGYQTTVEVPASPNICFCTT